MDFGKLEIVEKTFSRTVTNPRGQDFMGIKFRRWTSEKKGKEGQVEEQFTIAEKLFNDLNLKELALTQAEDAQNVYLINLEDRDDVKPVAKFMRQSTKKDGTKQEKGRFISNTFLIQSLVDRKILDPTTMENQYLALVDVTKEFGNVPPHVKGVYKLVIDESVNEEAEDEDKAETVATDNPAVVAAKDEF